MNVLQEHKQLVLGLLGGGASPPTVLDGSVPQGQSLPYLLVYFRLRTPTGVEEPDKVSLESTSDVITTTAYCHCVGENPTAALAVAWQARSRLLGVTPVIAGRVCAPITHEDSVPPARDESTGLAEFDLVDVYTFTSLPG